MYVMCIYCVVNGYCLYIFPILIIFTVHDGYHFVRRECTLLPYIHTCEHVDGLIEIG